MRNTNLIAKLNVRLNYECKGSLCEAKIKKLWSHKNASFSVQNDSTLRIKLKNIK